MATVQKTGVYWPFKNLLQGAGIVLTDDGNNVTVATTGPGPGGGDMLKTEFATNGATGVVDNAVHATNADNVSHAASADAVPWGGITGRPTIFPSDWASVANKPAVFPPQNHGSTHISTGVDPIPIAVVGASGLLPALSGSAGDYLDGTGAFVPFNVRVATTALQKAGDSLANNAILKGFADVPTDATGPSKAPLYSQSISQGGFGAIGLLSLNYWGCALGAGQGGLFIATTNGDFRQLTDFTGRIIGSALTSGAAITNLGYTPVSAGGATYPITTPIVFQKDVAIGSDSWSNAPLQISNLTSASSSQKPMIGFSLLGATSAALYWETDQTFRYVRSDGSVARFHDTLHPLIGTDLANGAAIANLYNTQQNAVPQGKIISFNKDVGVVPNSYQLAAFVVSTQTAAAGARPGIGFTHINHTGVYLYLDDDNKFKFMDANGLVHVISST
jgi:hypothetical protein